MKKVLKAIVTLVLTACMPTAALAAPADWPEKLTIGLIPVEG
jgi:ABC-type phosphate/phosphonate transport system substrate-binding protein